MPLHQNPSPTNIKTKSTLSKPVSENLVCLTCVRPRQVDNTMWVRRPLNLNV